MNDFEEAEFQKKSLENENLKIIIDLMVDNIKRLRDEKLDLEKINKNLLKELNLLTENLLADQKDFQILSEELNIEFEKKY